MIQTTWSRHRPPPAATTTTSFFLGERDSQRKVIRAFRKWRVFSWAEPWTSEINLFSSHLGWQQPHLWWRLTGWKIMKKCLQLSSWLPCYQACACRTKEMIWPLWARRELGMSLAGWFSTVWPRVSYQLWMISASRPASLHENSSAEAGPWSTWGTGSSFSPFYKWEGKTREGPAVIICRRHHPWALGSVSELSLTGGETLSRSFSDSVFSRGKYRWRQCHMGA